MFFYRGFAELNLSYDVGHIVAFHILVICQLDEGTPPEQDASFVDYQTKMVKTAKAITVTAQDMVNTVMFFSGAVLCRHCEKQ